MARQIDYVSVYLIVRRNENGTYSYELQNVQASASDPNPPKKSDKGPFINPKVEGMSYNGKDTLDIFLNKALIAAAFDADAAVYFDNVINRTTYEYRINVDGSSYDTNDWIINPNLDLVAGVEKKYWVVEGDQVVEANAEQKAEIDQIDFETAIAGKVFSMRDGVNKFIGGRYDLAQQQTLQTCWIEGLQKNWTNRTVMIQKVWDWCGIVINYFYDLKAQALAAKNFEELNNIVVDYYQFSAQDPNIITEDVKKTLD